MPLMEPALTDPLLMMVPPLIEVWDASLTVPPKARLFPEIKAAESRPQEAGYSCETLFFEIVKLRRLSASNGKTNTAQPEYGTGHVLDV